MFKILAKINLILLPSFTKQQLDMAKAKKWQLALIAWRYYVTIRALDYNSRG
ncbi:SsrA-binding protein [Flavobacterium sp.]|uniref:SsrA-binding protein n=1 Tax=Flavobacterium sp. TaxID=239 RepID=UPI00261F81C2|nr:SsrA-binding protein [Flavobacterium sp.]